MGTTEHEIPVLGTWVICLRDSSPNTRQCSFLVIESALSISGLSCMKFLSFSLYFFRWLSPFTFLNVNCSLFYREGGCQYATDNSGGFVIPNSLRHRIFLFGVQEPVKRIIRQLLEKGIFVPASPSAWAMPIVKWTEKTPRNSNGYRIMVNKVLKQKSCSTPVTEYIHHQSHRSKLFSKLDLPNALIPISPNDKLGGSTTISISFHFSFAIVLLLQLFRTMNIFISELINVSAHQDEISVRAPANKLYDDSFRLWHERFRYHSVVNNPDKCMFSFKTLPT